MPTYGLTTTGFAAKSQAIVQSELVAAFQAAFGASIDTSATSVFGVLIGILAEREGLLWSLAQAVAASQDPNQATGAALDALAALTGAFRTPATSSTVTLTLTGTPATVVALGSQAKTTSTASLFATTAAATIAALSAWSTAVAYTLGQRVTSSGKAYQCTTAGTSVTAPSGTAVANPDTSGSLVWRYLGVGTGAVDVAAASVLTGAIIGVSGDINLIQTAVGGWSNVTNVLDAVVGSPIMTDAALRILRTSLLSAAGVSTPNAIRAGLLQVAAVTSATVFVNNTDVVNVDSMPPHSVEALVQGGADAAVAAALFAGVAAGIAFQGTTTTSVTDSQGTAQTVKFSRPAQILIYSDITLVYDATKYAGDAAVQAAIVAYGQAQATGKDAVASGLAAACFGVAGVLDVNPVLISLAPVPTLSTTIAISTRQLAVYSTANIAIHSTAGTP